MGNGFLYPSETEVPISNVPLKDVPPLPSYVFLEFVDSEWKFQGFSSSDDAVTNWINSSSGENERIACALEDWFGPESL